MDAGVVSGLLQIATQGGVLAERTLLLKGVAGKRSATAGGCGGAGPSAASPLLPDAPRHRLRRGSLHPTPRRSQRRPTPFFHGLLVSCPRNSETTPRANTPILSSRGAPRRGIAPRISRVTREDPSLR